MFGGVKMRGFPWFLMFSAHTLNACLLRSGWNYVNDLRYPMKFYFFKSTLDLGL